MASPNLSTYTLIPGFTSRSWILAVLFSTDDLAGRHLAFQPREQVGKVPPREWLARRQFIELDGKEIAVTPPQVVGSEQAASCAWLRASRRASEVLVDPRLRGRQGRSTGASPTAELRRFSVSSCISRALRVRRSGFSPSTARQPHRPTRGAGARHAGESTSVRELPGGSRADGQRERQGARLLGELPARSTFP